jgi:hypothetical protein
MSATAQDLNVGMRELIEHPAEEKGGRHARRIDRCRAVAERDTRNAEYHRRVKPGNRAIGEVSVAQGDEGERAETDGKRHRHRGRDESSDQVVAQFFHCSSRPERLYRAAFHLPANFLQGGAGASKWIV